MIISRLKKLFVVIAISMMAIIVLSCNNDEGEIAEAYSKTAGPMEVSEQLHLYVSRSASLQYEFSAPLLHVYYEPRSYRDTPKGFRLVSFTKEGGAETEITAHYGIYDEKKSQMEAKNNVVIKKLQTGELIETEHLVWDMNNHKIYSDTKIKQTKPDGSVYIGDSFESDEDMSYYLIRKPQLLIYE